MYKRTFAAVAILILLASMYHAGTAEALALAVKSPAFIQGGRMPVKYTCDGEDISPQLSWEPGPPATESYALIVDDPDAPGGTFTHWLVYNIPSNVTRLEEHVTGLPGMLQGKNSYGRAGYGGPCPPPGKLHHYRFNVYALDSRLKLAPGASKDDLMGAMRGHVLAQGELTGVYGR